MTDGLSISNSVSGTITTQNLNAATTATANSAVVVNCDYSTQSVCCNVSGTYTSGAAATLFGLVAQGSADGINWTTIPRIIRVVRHELISNIPSAETGAYIIPNRGFKQIRVCCVSGAFT